VGQVPEKVRRQRKMLLLFPLIVVPLLCVAFHGLGGGKGDSKEKQAVTGKGLNMALPEARFDPKKKTLNKLGFYKQADQDSVRLLESRKLDPYYNKNGLGPAVALGGMSGRRDTGLLAGRVGRYGLTGGSGPDEKADELLQKLDRLKEVLGRQALPDKPELGAGIGKGGLPSSALPSVGVYSGRPGILAAGVPVVPQHDHELDQLDGLVDKILRIQHPGEDRVADTAASVHSGPVVASLSLPKKEEVVKMLVDREDVPGPGSGGDSVVVVPGSGFMDLDDEQSTGQAPGDAVEAVIAHDQTLVSGEAVELRLDQAALINGVSIPKGTQVWGKASLSGERLQVMVTSIRDGNGVMPVSLEVFDLDGMSGVRVPGAINRDVSKQSADEAINTLGVAPVDASVGGQATAAGLQAAKTLLSRKVRLVRVSLKAGYRVLLKNTKTK